jgi:aspartate-semialdehyde dehydrogenase
MADERRRILVAGATGLLGEELLAVLSERNFPVGELLPLGGDRTAGEEIEFRGESWSVLAAPESWSGVDLAFLCAPPAISLELSRQALRAAVPCIDCSGALAGRDEVPLLAAALDPPDAALRSPLVAAAAGPALAPALVLGALGRAAGLRRIGATLLLSVAAGGRAGVESLSAESVALFNQDELPDPTVFPASVAFDCQLRVGRPGDDGATEVEHAIAAAWRRLVAPEAGIAVQAVRAPVFCGDAALLSVETLRPLEAGAAAELLAKTAGVVLHSDAGPAPGTRAVAGRDEAVVARVLRDASRESGLALSVLGDATRLTAVNAVRLAELRFL